MEIDYAALAARLSAADFAIACPFPLLVGRDVLQPPERRHVTIDIAILRDRDDHTLTAVPAVPKRGVAPSETTLAVRKVHNTFPAMITVGRTANNDIVLNDLLVSKFHAFFRVDGAKLELCDGGSKNGTWLNDTQLTARELYAVKPGDRIRFASLRFRLLAAADYWNELRARR